MPKPLNAAQQKLVTENLGLVRAQVRHFSGLRILSADDLYSDGCLALTYAAEAWQGKGAFSTYATIAIKRQMVKAITLANRNRMRQEPINEGNDGRELDGIPDVDAIEPGDDAAGRERDPILGAVDRLPPRERQYIVEHFGLEGSDPVTIFDLSNRDCVPKKRVSDCVRDGLARLRQFAQQEERRTAA